jgi:hypothetical protein
MRPCRDDGNRFGEDFLWAMLAEKVPRGLTSHAPNPFTEGPASDAANGPTAVSHGSNATAPAGPGMIVSRWVRSIPL